MIIKAMLPTTPIKKERVVIIDGEEIRTPAHSFKKEERDVEVVRVLRYPLGKDKKRFHYAADIVDHPDIHPDARDHLMKSLAGLVRVRIQRNLNPRWKPPVFPKGVDMVEVAGD